MFAAEAQLDLPNERLGLATTADVGEDSPGVLPLVGCHEEARRFGNEQDADEKRCRGHGLHPEHPAPGGRAEPERRAGAAGGPRKHVIA